MASSLSFECCMVCSGLQCSCEYLTAILQVIGSVTHELQLVKQLWTTYSTKHLLPEQFFWGGTNPSRYTWRVDWTVRPFALSLRTKTIRPCGTCCTRCWLSSRRDFIEPEQQQQQQQRKGQGNRRKKSPLQRNLLSGRGAEWVTSFTL